MAATSLPPYAVRVSKRAKRVLLSARPETGIEVVLPEPLAGIGKADLEALLTPRADWMLKAQAELTARGFTPEPMERLPETIRLPLLAREWYVVRSPGPGRSRLAERGDALYLGGREDGEAWTGLLIRWLTARAKETLPPQTHAVAAELGKAPASVRIRMQRSRWGSCTCRGAISLNARLLLLEEPLVRFVVLHECCHLVHLDHSSAFKKLLGAYEPGWRSLDKAVDAAWKELPAWTF